MRVEYLDSVETDITFKDLVYHLAQALCQTTYRIILDRPVSYQLY